MKIYAAVPSWATLLIYALPAFPLAVLSFPFFVLVPDFYTRSLGLPIASVGYALLAARIVDAISDPLAGLLADRLKPTTGRRRTWVVLMAPFTAVSAWLVFNPPDDVTAWYLALCGIALSITWTLMQVPYLAWGAELSRSYDGRSRVVAIRESFSLVGVFMALVAPAIIAGTGAAQTQAVLFSLSLMVALGLPITALLAFLCVSEPRERSVSSIAFGPGVKLMLANKPFVRLTTAFFVNGFANGLPATLFLLFVAERLQAEAQAGLFLILYFASAVMGLPLWIWLAKRLSKHQAWCAGMVLACLSFGYAMFLGPGDTTSFALICVVTGLALGGDVALPASIQADVIDLDLMQSGEERSGLFLGVWAFASKLALAGAAGFAFPLLAASGFDPGQNVRTQGGLMMLAFLYAGLPVVLKIGAIALMWRFPFGKAQWENIMAQTLSSETSVEAPRLLQPVPQEIKEK